MRKIVFLLFVLFIFALPALAGEKIDHQPKGQIILAGVYDDCKRDCGMERSSCESNCSREIKDRHGYSRSICKNECVRAYSECVSNCPR